MSGSGLVTGVDSSTQSCKVVVLDSRTGAEARAARASHPEGTEVDPTAWWEALLTALSSADGLGDDVEALVHDLEALRLGLEEVDRPTPGTA